MNLNVAVVTCDSEYAHYSYLDVLHCDYYDASFQDPYHLHDESVDRNLLSVQRLEKDTLYAEYEGWSNEKVKPAKH